MRLLWLRRNRLTVAASALVVGAGLVMTSAGPAHASTPGSGTVSDSSPTTSWTGGPFLIANTTGTAGDPICNAVVPCDDFKLTVNTPSGYETDHSLKITVQWPQTAADFDVYLLDSTGTVIEQAASSADPEILFAVPLAGVYTVRIVPFNPLGESYSASASLVALPPAPPNNPGGATFTQYPAPDSMPNAHGAGEPSIGTNWKTGATLYQSIMNTYKVTFNDSFTPAKATYADKSATATNGCLTGGTTSLDPILFTDHATGRTFESQLSGLNSLTCYTDDDGESWLPSTGGGIPSGVDHQTIGGGPFSANGLPGIGVYPNAVYYCSQDIATAFCAISRDGGTTFGPGVPTYSLLDCGGLHGHVKVAADGTAYVPNKGCGGNQAVVVSEDNGTSWAVRKIPSSTPGDTDPSVGIGAKGTIYTGYQAADGSARIAVSRDKGKTWTNDINVGAALGVKNAVFPAVVAGDDDRAAFAFIGTTTGGNYQDSKFAGVWHLYVATTYDGGLTWSTVDTTPTDPVQRGSICTGGTTCGDDRNLLDFFDVTIDKQGRVEVGYADGCTGACATGGNENYDALATIARQSGGKTLFAAYDSTLFKKRKR